VHLHACLLIIASHDVPDPMRPVATRTMAAPIWLAARRARRRRLLVAAEAAGGQARFWALHDALDAHQRARAPPPGSARR
jgi:hypothetical protein